MVKNSTQKIKLIYCMGSGRSGSTLLNIILDNHPDIAGLGELNNISRLSQEKFNCSCGERVEECEFWSAVMEEWRRTSGSESIKEYMKQMHAIERSKSPMAWLKMLFKYPGQSQYFQNYQKNTYELLKSMQKISGKSVIVDISKNPLRAYALHKHPLIDLKLIHLVRDGRGVAWSLHKFTKAEVQQKQVWRTALFWVIVNRLSNFVRRKAKNSGLIIYENFVKFPERTTKEISEIVDVDLQPILKIINSDVAPKDSHVMAGNKLRKAKSITLKLDTEWREKMDIKKQKVFLRIAGRSMSNYGYLEKNANNLN